MATKRRTFWAVVLSITGTAVLAFVTAAWAYTNGVEGRLSTCEAVVENSQSDIREVKKDVKELRTQQTKMWVDLGERIDRKH